MQNQHIRNIAIIAHVDHGKTTCIDAILKQSGSFHKNAEVTTRVMDSNAIEQARGITILSKCTSINWKDHRINIVDTPGHADFGSEVERILKLVDGILLVVDALEGVMSQTRFVLSKAMEYKLKPIIFINKIDRGLADPHKTSEEVLDLLLSFGGDIFNCPVFYGSGREGYAFKDLSQPKDNLYDMLDEIVEHIPGPEVGKEEDPFRMLVSIVDSSEHLGRLLIGKPLTGSVKIGNWVYARKEGNVEKFRITKILRFVGINKEEIEESETGDIVLIAGAKNATVNYTISSVENFEDIEAPKIMEHTISVIVGANTSPVAGKEGTKLTTNQIRERLLKEAEINIGIAVVDMGERFEIFGRGELQLSVLLENMRREGFEMMLYSPRIITKKIDGKTLEPVELVEIQIDSEYMGSVIDKMGLRGGEITDMIDGDKMKIKFKIPSRLMLGYFFEFMSDTKGSGIMSRELLAYEPISPTKLSVPGLIISMDSGKATAYSLDNLRDRGTFFIPPNAYVYKGMIIGEHNRPANVEVNPTKEKKMSNVRASGKDDAINPIPYRALGLEEAIAYVASLENAKIEITPQNVRLAI